MVENISSRLNLGKRRKILLKGKNRLSQDQISEILKKAKTIAVVGLSKEPEKDSYKVSAYLQQHRYRIIPGNPADMILEKSYKSLIDIP
jgi:predicted CoA-binding protein